MATVNIYLNFDGNCMQAFDFYKSVFKKDFQFVGKFDEMPSYEGAPPVSDDLKGKIMHISLPISKETILMGSDTGGEWSSSFKQGNNFSISVGTKSIEEADEIFNALADGGEITMPIEKTFWESYFGMLTDKFGIAWQVSCELASHKDFENANK